MKSALFAIALGSATAIAQEPSSTVTVVGCVQRAERDAITRISSPSGFVLMNASTSPYGGGVGPDATGATATTGASQHRSEPRSGDSRNPGGSAGSPGLTFLLDGSNLESHAGQRVEMRGTLQPTISKLPLSPGSARGGSSSNLPQRLRVESIKTLAKDCSR